MIRILHENLIRASAETFSVVKLEYSFTLAGQILPHSTLNRTNRGQHYDFSLWTFIYLFIHSSIHSTSLIFSTI